MIHENFNALSSEVLAACPAVPALGEQRRECRRRLGMHTQGKGRPCGCPPISTPLLNLLRALRGIGHSGPRSLCRFVKINAAKALPGGLSLKEQRKQPFEDGLWYHQQSLPQAGRPWADVQGLGSPQSSCLRPALEAGRRQGGRSEDGGLETEDSQRRLRRSRLFTKLPLHRWETEHGCFNPSRNPGPTRGLAAPSASR